LQRRASSTACAVLLEPAPAITGTRPAAPATHTSTTRTCSSVLSVTLSPVVPHGTRACEPSATWRSTNVANARSSTLPLRKGVIRAGIDPRIVRNRALLCAIDAIPATLSGEVK
jgi:hypothetical protein